MNSGPRGEGIFLKDASGTRGELWIVGTGCHSVGWDVRGLDMLQTMWCARVGVVQAGAKRRFNDTWCATR